MTHVSEQFLIRSAMGAEWDRLPESIRQRFTRDAARGTRMYHGVMQRVWCSWPARLMAWCASLVSAPLIPHRGQQVPILVEVRQGSQAVWKQRDYHFPDRNIVRVLSRMEYVPALGFMEYVGLGLGMAMRVTGEDDALCFRSTGYYWRFGARHIRLPHWLTPGETCVRHRSVGADRFRVDLTMIHPWFGLMFVQEGLFTDDGDAA